MLRRSGVQAIHALLELAQAPERWRSVHQLALAQNLPEPTLEQLLLRLRRAGLVQARRGRLGGYRLAADPSTIAVAAIVAAAGAAEHGQGQRDTSKESGGEEALRLEAGRRVTDVLERRLQLAIERELARLTLADLVFDLQSAQASLSEDGGLLLG